MLSGLPQLIIPVDAEKRLNCDALVELGLAIRASFDGMEPGPFSAVLRAAWADEALRERARAAAPGFRSRMFQSLEATAAASVEAILQQA